MSLPAFILRLAVLPLLVALALLAGRGAGSPDSASAEGSHGPNSCAGELACHLNSGHVGANSCNAVNACFLNSGNIGDNSCNGFEACMGNTGDIGDTSCDFSNACKDQGGSIGDNSCNQNMACWHNGSESFAGSVGDSSCNANQACAQNGAGTSENPGFGLIGSFSCNAEEACSQNGYLGIGFVQIRSCNAEQACAGNGKDGGTGTVRNDSCNAYRACLGNGQLSGKGVIADHSCNAVQACFHNGRQGGDGSIGANSCNGVEACISNGFVAPNSGTVGSYSCNGDHACPLNRSDIGDCQRNVVFVPACDTTPPVALPTQSPLANANGWNNSDVTVSWHWSDGTGGSGIDPSQCTTSTPSSGVGSLTLNATCRDLAGNIGNASRAVKVDKTKPLITSSRAPAANAFGWTNVDVVVSFTCIDVGASGLDSNTVAGATVSTEGLAQSATNTGTCADKAGNVADSATVSGIAVDKTKPVATAAASPVPNANGWNNTNVTVTHSGSDSLSGINSCSAPVTMTADAANQTSAAGTCTDKAGNVSNQVSVSGVNIDKTPPVVQITGGSIGQTYVLGSMPAPGCNTTDAVSGVQTAATLGLSGAPVGPITATCSGATDKAGNAAAAVNVTYTVIYSWTGFFKPLDNLPALNAANAGTAVSVKFGLGGAQGLNILAPNSPSSAVVACGTTAPESATVATISTGNSSLSYASGQYSYDWKTDKSWSGQCRQLTIKLIDGTVHKALFTFK